MWRSEDEMLAVVEGRAAGRRRRRHVAGLGSGATVLLVVAVLAAGARTGDRSRPLDVASAGGAVSGGPTTTVAPVPGLVFPPPDPTSTVAGPPLPPFGFPPPAPPTTTTLPPGGDPPPTTAPPPAGSATTERAGLCAREAVAYGVSVSKPAYLTGEQVRATATFRNTGATPCFGPSSLIVQWEDGAGRSIIAIGTHADCFEPRPCGPLLAPGESYTSVQCWDQRDETGMVPAGTYGVTFSLDDYRGHATFEIVADPSGTTTTRPPMAPFACS